ncbi:MAG: ROK family protein [Patescibacteria group bacterium]|jgi:predicted NBD/HSP70 family sugar kinase|nr:ROK family protein [Patescibacteria group bacterium]
MLKRKKRIITFDIGGTNISGGVIEFKRKEYEFLDYFEQKNPKNSQKIRKMLLEKSEQYRKDFKVKKVAISTAKIVDNEKNCVLQAKPVYGVERFSFDFFKKKKFKVEIENDGICFARGEYLFGKGEAKGLLTLTIGTVIGGGFILQEREVLKGSNNSAMEVSYIRLKNKGKWFNWSELIAGRGIEKSFFSKTRKRLKTEEIFELQKKGNEDAKKVLEEAQEFLGMGVASLINIFDPEKIVFGGGLSKQKDFMKKSIEIAKKNVFNKKGKYKFEISSLGRKVNQLGSASLYF